MTLRLRTKIIGSFALTFFLLSLVTLIVIYNRNILLKSLFKLEEKIYEIYIISDVQLNINRVVMPANDYLITGDKGERGKFQEIVGDVDRGFDQLGGLSNKGHYPLVKESRERFTIIRGKAKEIFAIQNPVGDKHGAQLMHEMDGIASDIILNYLNRIHGSARSEVAELLDLVESNKKRVDMLILTGILISLITVCLLILYLHRSILRPILLFKDGVFIIGSGNLDHRIHIKDGLEINHLAEQFNRMAQRLQESHTALERKVEERTRELVELNMKLRELSITDGLTSLYNSRHFYERLGEEIKRAERYSHPLSLIMIDIDHFKKYNDTYGHIIGDHFLRKAARCIRLSVRETDMAARYGGEEFTIILPETDKEGARILAERIRSTVAGCTCYTEESLPDCRMTVSLGIATFPDDASGLKGLIEKADEALYRAKENGRNRVAIG